MCLTQKAEEPGMVAHTCDHRAQKEQAGEPPQEGNHHGLHSELLPTPADNSKTWYQKIQKAS